jgi:hypothetical protein
VCLTETVSEHPRKPAEPCLAGAFGFLSSPSDRFPGQRSGPEADPGINPGASRSAGHHAGWRATVPCGTGLRSPCPSLRIDLHNVYRYKPLIAVRTPPRGLRRTFAGPHRCDPACVDRTLETAAPALAGRGSPP